MLADSTKPRHYRIHLTASNCTLISIVCNVLLFLVLLHSWSAPCDHGESAHLQDALAKIQAVNYAAKYDSTPDVTDTNTVAIADSDNGESEGEHDFTLKSVGTRSLQTSDEDRTTHPVLGSIWSPPAASDLLAIKNDLSLNTSFQLSEHEHEWKYCSVGGDGDTIIPTPIAYCPQTPQVEQRYQMSWFGTHVVPGLKRPFPRYLGCVHLPPTDYQWPNKFPELPATGDAIHWPNLRVASHKELKVFNMATPKNLYHFDAPKYDMDAMGELSWAAKYIPFGPKVRLMLDVGAGGGSLGLLLKRKYDVQVLSTVFADWPYCEYITERGGLCMLVDVMEPMPFAKFTFDVLHVSWVYHGQHPDELLVMFNELNRIIRPGGYLWMRGGWSRKQVDTLRGLLVDKFGYQVLVQQEKPKPAEITAKVKYGDGLPYEVDWDVILVKPIAAQRKPFCVVTTPNRLPQLADEFEMQAQQQQQQAQQQQQQQPPTQTQAVH